MIRRNNYEHHIKRSAPLTYAAVNIKIKINVVWTKSTKLIPQEKCYIRVKRVYLFGAKLRLSPY